MRNLDQKVNQQQNTICLEQQTYASPENFTPTLLVMLETWPCQLECPCALLILICISPLFPYWGIMGIYLYNHIVKAIKITYWLIVISYQPSHSIHKILQELLLHTQAMYLYQMIFLPVCSPKGLWSLCSLQTIT